VTQEKRGSAAPPLGNRHVYLRAITPGDYGRLHTIETTGDIAVRWRLRGSTPAPEQWARALWTDVLAQFIVMSRASDTPVGMVTVYQANLRDGHAMLAATRFGPASRAPAMIIGLGIFLRYVFSGWELRKLYMELPEYNFPQFSSGLGDVFVLEARLRGHYYYAGDLWDKLVLAIYREAWVEGDPDSVTGSGSADPREPATGLGRSRARTDPSGSRPARGAAEAGPR
jgi:hypothetical protein